jgi:hypothetical protein
MYMPCDHKNFEGDLDIQRIVREDGEDGEGVIAYRATLKVRCRDCHTRFRFPGTPKGLLWSQPTTDPSEMELKIPMYPDGHRTSVLADLPGFQMRQVRAGGGS